MVLVLRPEMRLTPYCGQAQPAAWWTLTVSFPLTTTSLLPKALTQMGTFSVSQTMFPQVRRTRCFGLLFPDNAAGPAVRSDEIHLVPFFHCICWSSVAVHKIVGQRLLDAKGCNACP